MLHIYMANLNLAEFDLLQNLHLCTTICLRHKLRTFEKLALIILYNFHHEHSFLKIKAKINVKNKKIEYSNKSAIQEDTVHDDFIIFTVTHLTGVIQAALSFTYYWSIAL